MCFQLAPLRSHNCDITICRVPQVVAARARFEQVAHLLPNDDMVSAGRSLSRDNDTCLEARGLVAARHDGNENARAEESPEEAYRRKRSKRASRVLSGSTVERRKCG